MDVPAGTSNRPKNVLLAEPHKQCFEQVLIEFVYPLIRIFTSKNLSSTLEPCGFVRILLADP